MIFALRDHYGIFAKLVDRDTGKSVVKEQLYRGAFAGKHTKVGIRVRRHVKFGKFLFALPPAVSHSDLNHLIDTEMLHHTVFKSQQIVFFIIQQQSPRTDGIAFSVSAVNAVLCPVPGEITEHDPAIGVDGRIYPIHVVENGLVHRLDAPANPNLAPKLCCLINAAELLQPADQAQRLVLGNKFG